MNWTERRNIDGWLIAWDSDDGRWRIEPMEDSRKDQYALIDLTSKDEEIVINDSDIDVLKRIAEERAHSV